MKTRMRTSKKINIILSKIIFSILLFTSIIQIYSQQDPHYTQYMYNTMSVNPAYAGSKGYFSSSILARMQWVGIEGAPQVQNISFNTPVGYSGVGLGLNLINDKIGPSTQTTLDTSISYTIRTRDNGNLAFGIKIGGKFMNLDWSKGSYNTANDNAFNENINNELIPNFGMGLYYYTNKWYIGLSTPNIVRTKSYSDSLGSVISEIPHYFVIAGYVIGINENLKFKPAIMSKVVNGSPLSVDTSANFLVNNRLYLGMAYRWGDSVSALLGLQISENFRIGYSYDLTTSNYNSYNSGTHEVILTIDILNKQTIKSPRFF